MLVRAQHGRWAFKMGKFFDFAFLLHSFFLPPHFFLFRGWPFSSCLSAAL
jgi:hypothetical protein